jgi:hypothetical protein
LARSKKPFFLKRQVPESAWESQSGLGQRGGVGFRERRNMRTYSAWGVPDPTFEPPAVGFASVSHYHDDRND